MHFLYDLGEYGPANPWKKQVADAASRLRDKVDRLDIDALDISDYNKKYLTTQRSEMPARLFSYVFCLLNALRDIKKPLSEIRLVDYGGGAGMQSLLAHEAGIGKVVYCDIYDVSCHDAKVIGKALHNEAEAYVEGDIHQLIDYLKMNVMDVDVMASNDVIEHIYDIDEYLRRLADVPGPDFRASLVTTANIFNKRNSNKLMKMQYARENEDLGDYFGHKERDARTAYISIRRAMISEHSPELDDQVVEKLAKLTRGMRKEHIVQAVDNYEANGHMPVELEHPTNTCDPFTGNWCEHLMNPFELVDSVKRVGLSASLLPGYYHQGNSIIARFVRAGANALIRLQGVRGLWLSPLWAIHLRKQA